MNAVMIVTVIIVETIADMVTAEAVVNDIRCLQ